MAYCSILYPLIFILQAAALSVPGHNDASSVTLNLEKADQIRISLFSANTPDSLRLTADSVSLELYSGDSKIRFNNLSVDLGLTLADEKLFFETSGIRHPIDSLRITSGTPPIRLITEQLGYRYYRGSLLIKPANTQSTNLIINTVDLEEYIASVVGSEMNFEEPEALNAQAVVSRTYALWSIAKTPYNEFDLKDYEANQMYIGYIQGNPHYAEAAAATKGEVITWSGQLIMAVYSSTCGGVTANNEDVWDGQAHPYLRSRHDAQMCVASPHYNWNHTLSHRELHTIVRERYGFKFAGKDIEKDASGRVNQVKLINNSGEQLRFTGNEFRFLINQAFGPMTIRSTRYSWNDNGEEITIEGSGLGHGVGMCQWGARGFAENGWTYKDILSFYFSGTKIVNLSDINSNHLPLYQ